MAERRAVELDAGARKLGRDDVLTTRLLVPLMLRIAKVYYGKTGYGYSSLRFSLFNGQITTFVDRASDALYRLKQVYGSPSKTQTTNYVDWPELAELYKFLYEHRER